MSTYTALTLNAAFLPRTPVSPNLPDYNFRADKIAERVKALKIDLLVLNEVFVPEIRQRLVRALESEYSIPAGLDTGFFLDSTDGAPMSMTDVPVARSARSAARMTMRAIAADSTLTMRERNRAVARAGADVPFIDSGLFFATRRTQAIIPGGAPGFVPWRERGVESISANMGYFHVGIGLRDAVSPGAIDLFGLHMNPYTHHADIRRTQLAQLRKRIDRMDEGVFSPRLKLIFGDFNIVGESSEYDSTIASGVLPGGVDLFRAAHPNKKGFTWSNENPLTDFALGGGGPNERLDYAVSVRSSRCKKKLNVTRVEVEKMEVSEYQYEYASDHFGLLLEFDLVNA